MKHNLEAGQHREAHSQTSWEGQSFYKKIEYFFDGEEIKPNFQISMEVAREVLAVGLEEVSPQHEGDAVTEVTLAKKSVAENDLMSATEHIKNAQKSTGVLGWFSGKTGFVKAIVLGSSLFAAACAPKGKMDTYTEHVSESVIPKSVDVNMYQVGKSWGNLWGDLKEGKFDWDSFKKLINPADVSLTLSGEDRKLEATMLYELSRAFNSADLKNPADVAKLEKFLKEKMNSDVMRAVFASSPGTRAAFEKKFPQYAGSTEVAKHIREITFIGGASPEGKGSANWERGKVDLENVALAELRAKDQAGKQKAALVSIFKKLGIPYDAKTIEIGGKENQLHVFNVLALTRLADKYGTDVTGLIEMVNTNNTSIDKETLDAVNNILEPLRNSTVTVKMENDVSTTFAIPLSPLYLLLICIIRPEWCRMPPPPPPPRVGGGSIVPPGQQPVAVKMPPAPFVVEPLIVAPEKNPRDYMDDAHGRIVAQRTGYYELLFRLFSDESAAHAHAAGVGLENSSDREIARNRLARLLLDNWNADTNAIRDEAGLQPVDYMQMNDQRMDALILATAVQRLVEEQARTESLATYRELMLDPGVKDLVFQDITRVLEEIYDRNPSLRNNRPAGTAHDLSA